MISKQDLRGEARARRTELAREQPDHAARLADHGRELPIARGSLIGAYAALPGEADPHLLVERLAEQGCAIAFPQIAAKASPLQFHLWRAGQTLMPGTHGVREPSADWPVAVPQIVLVPLLAFDAMGHRLGYGGGYYDRTLARLRPQGVIAIGVAFAGQEVDALPGLQHDERLDMVLTELGVRRFG